MNLLFVETSISPHLGGVERVTWQVSSWLKEHNYKCYYAYYCEDGSGLVTKEDTLSYNLSMTERDFVDVFTKFIKEKAIDVVVSQGIIMWQIWALFKTLRSNKICKCIYFYHNTPDIIPNIDTNWYIKILKMFVPYLPCNTLMQKLRQRFNQQLSGVFAYKQLYRNVDQWLLLSESFRAPFLFKINEKEDHVTCITNPLSLKMETEDFSRKEKVVLFLGRIEERQKNITGALRIWKKVEESESQGWNLEVVGDGPDMEMAKQYAKDLKLERVRFLGATKHPEDFYRRASIFMMTSNYEGFGLTLTEAQQFGCVPIVYDTFTALHDIVSDGVNGIIIKREDENSFVERIIHLINSEESRTNLTKAMRRTVDGFKLKKIGVLWETMLDNL